MNKVPMVMISIWHDTIHDYFLEVKLVKLKLVKTTSEIKQVSERGLEFINLESFDVDGYTSKGCGYDEVKMTIR